MLPSDSDSLLASVVIMEYGIVIFKIESDRIAPQNNRITSRFAV